MEEEKAFMKLLPNGRYELAVWNPNIKVSTDYLVSDGKNKYSVPFDLIGEKVDIRLTSSTVEVFFHDSRVASHMRKPAVQRDPIVNSEHMTPEHRKYLNYNTEDFTVWAKSIGDNTARVTAYFLTAGKESEQGYKACASLTKLGERYGKTRLEASCAEVLKYTSAPSIRLLNTILKSGIFSSGEAKSNAGHTESSHGSSNAYGITRGAAYYGRNGRVGVDGKDGDSK